MGRTPRDESITFTGEYNALCHALADRHALVLLLRTDPNARANAREKLTRLTRPQFQELSTDVYDELMRRKKAEGSALSGSAREYLPFASASNGSPVSDLCPALSLLFTLVACLLARLNFDSEFLQCFRPDLILEIALIRENHAYPMMIHVNCQ